MSARLMARLQRLEAAAPEPVKRLRILRVPVGRTAEEFLPEAAQALDWPKAPRDMDEASAMLDDAAWRRLYAWLLGKVRTQGRVP